MIPSTSTNSAFTVDNVAIDDGSSVATGTTVTLACDSGYTYQGASSYEESCAAADTTLKSECFCELLSCCHVTFPVVTMVTCHVTSPVVTMVTCHVTPLLRSGNPGDDSAE